MPRSTRTRTALAERAWRVMFDFLSRSAPARTRSLGRRRLTPNDSRALASLDVREGRTMRSLADAWDCDPSNATWVIDRLETLGLVERRTVARDRRIKLVVLTPKGEKTKTALLDEFHRPPAELAALDRDDLETLHRVLTRLAPESRLLEQRAPKPHAPNERASRDRTASARSPERPHRTSSHRRHVKTPG